MEGVQERLRQIGDLNKERSTLMSAIDNVLGLAIATGRVPKQDRTKL